MRLTNDMRDSITRSAVEGTLSKRAEWLKRESSALAGLVYDRIYQPIEQTQMSVLTDGFFYERSEIYVQLPKSLKSGDRILLNLTSSKRIAAKHNCYREPCWKCEEDNAVVRRILNYSDKLQKYKDDEQELRSSIRRMLAGIMTVKRLEEEWPQGLPYYQNKKPMPPTKNVPAIRGTDITKMMELLEADFPQGIPSEGDI